MSDHSSAAPAIPDDRVFPAPIATVDVALFSISPDGQFSVLLIKREREPYAGALALPGGFVRTVEDDSTDAAARRVLAEKVRLREGSYYMEQLYTFSGLGRDPRGWSLSVSYYAVAPWDAIETGIGAVWVAVEHIPEMGLPFDHHRIVGKALERIRNKSSYSSLPAYLLDEMFTLDELRHVYELVMATDLERMTFRKKIEDQKMIEPVKGKLRRGNANRPAQLYRLNDRRLREFNRTLTKR